jgi:hypothetical protein
LSSEYVQTTGRGGRDGMKCCCTLFFRSEDFSQVKNVINFRKLTKEDQDRYSVAISNVFKVSNHIASIFNLETGLKSSIVYCSMQLKDNDAGN